jgi:hypothetical protein
MQPRRRSRAITGFDAGPPAAPENLFDALPALRNLSAGDGIESGHQSRVLDHEGHQLRRVAADAEELEPVLLDEFLKGGMRGNAHAMSVGVPQDLPEGHEWLYITSRSNNLYHDVELWRRRLPSLAAKTWRDVRRRQRSLARDPSSMLNLPSQGRRNDVGDIS